MKTPAGATGEGLPRARGWHLLADVLAKIVPPNSMLEGTSARVEGTRADRVREADDGPGAAGNGSAKST